MSAQPPGSPQPGPSLPPSPWILADTTTIEQAAAAGRTRSLAEQR
jgi:hypothetical protein